MHPLAHDCYRIGVSVDQNMGFPWVCHVCQAAFFGIRFSNLVGSWADPANVMFHGTTQCNKKGWNGRFGRLIYLTWISYTSNTTYVFYTCAYLQTSLARILWNRHNSKLSKLQTYVETTKGKNKTFTGLMKRGRYDSVWFWFVTLPTNISFYHIDMS